MSDLFIPYGRQWVDDEDIQCVVDVLCSDFLTTGPAVERFEQTLAHYTGARHVVAVNSGTAALHTAYYAAGLQAGDEIITSPLTFVATANAALYLGATVKFVDVRPDTGTLDPSRLEEAITRKTKLIVPVDYAGHPADYDNIRAIAQRYGITVVADAAHSLGAVYRGRKVGTLAGLTTVSFHPVKPVTTGEGGAVLTDDPEWARRAAQFRSHGIVRDSRRLPAGEGPWYYEMQDIGYNYRITDIQCALGTSQMRRLDEFIRRRRVIAERYTEAFRDLPGLEVPVVLPGVEPGWHLYVVRLEGGPAVRRRVFERLREAGIGVQVHYIPVHFHPVYRKMGYTEGMYPCAEDFYRRAISLPLYPKMTDDEVEFVVETVRRVVRDVVGGGS
ncbi:MAG: UDP-4-amino-4,6-dideoxy-N-acetyl-beta-L-altrosamine transaminase [Alicyclobacillaceae bacterium]|nr:UDP-4-amino-4,6-dideoxy-N-acetyl-beta-L-altrosamine transaminase [Alicyclobacillaceae bacterium]